MNGSNDIDRNEDSLRIASSTNYYRQFSYYNSHISSLDLENTKIILIEKYAFSCSYQLKEVTFLSCLQEICEKAFFKCENLKIIKFGDGAFM